MINSVTGRQRDRYDVGAQIADLSRGTADIGRQVSELDRRIVAMEGDIAAELDRSHAATAPLATEIGELGELVKDLADAVARTSRCWKARSPMRRRRAGSGARRRARAAASAHPSRRRGAPRVGEPEPRRACRPQRPFRGWSRRDRRRSSRAPSRPIASISISSRS
jgi:cyclic-di-GMP phosphodiesterase TipF (flagellum assembly factor)